MLPILLLVIILNFTIVHIENEMLVKFIIGAILVIRGLEIFLFGTRTVGLYRR